MLSNVGAKEAKDSSKRRLGQSRLRFRNDSELEDVVLHALGRLMVSHFGHKQPGILKEYGRNELL